MTKFRRLISLLLCMLMLLSAMSACKPTPQDPEDTTPPTVTPPEDNTPEQTGNPIALIKDKAAVYSIVYADTLSEEGVEAASRLRDALSTHTQEPVSCGKDTETEQAQYEILIGTTDRVESRRVRPDLLRFSYIVRVVDTKIVICATHDWMLTLAVTGLTRSMKAERDENKQISALTVMDDLSILFDFTKDMDYSRAGWALSKFPAFFSGTLVEKTYTKTAGLDASAPTAEDYQMQIATDVDYADFRAYANALSANGFTVTRHATNEKSIISYWVEMGKNRMYMYYTASTKEVRFILDQEDSAPLSEFAYTYEKQEGDSTTVYLYGLKLHPDGINIGEKYPAASNTAFYEQYPELAGKASKKQETYKNCGAMYVIKLADNSVIIVDGGDYKSMSVEQAVYLNEFLHEITDTPMNEKVRISCWFITHPHGDHYSGFVRFMLGFHKYYEMERLMYNMETHGIIPVEQLKQWYPSLICHRLHTGESFQLANVKINVLFTLEDLVRVGSMTCEYWPEGTAPDKIADESDDNNTSAVLRLTIDGKTVMLTGDIASEASKVLLRNYEANDHAELKADMLQIPHHGWNNLSAFFKAVSPSISVFNQSKGGAQKGLKGKALKTYNAAASATKGGEKNMYFSGDETVGFQVKSGKLEVVFREAAVGYAWDGSDGGAESRWNVTTAFPAI